MSTEFLQFLQPIKKRRLQSLGVVIRTELSIVSGISTKLIKYKKQNTQMTLLDTYMLGVAIAGSSVFYLQAYKIFTTKSVEDISVAGFSISLFCSISWLSYAAHKGDIPLLISGGLCSLGGSLVVLGIFCYRKH